MDATEASVVTIEAGSKNISSRFWSKIYVATAAILFVNPPGAGAHALGAAVATPLSHNLQLLEGNAIRDNQVLTLAPCCSSCYTSGPSGQTVLTFIYIHWNAKLIILLIRF